MNESEIILKHKRINKFVQNIRKELIRIDENMTCHQLNKIFPPNNEFTVGKYGSILNIIDLTELRKVLALITKFELNKEYSFNLFVNLVIEEDVRNHLIDSITDHQIYEGFNINESGYLETSLYISEILIKCNHFNELEDDIINDVINETSLATIEEVSHELEPKYTHLDGYKNMSKILESEYIWKSVPE